MGTHKNTGCSLVSCRAINIYDTYNKCISYFFGVWGFWKINIAKGERWKMRLYVLRNPWVTANLNIEILFILCYNSFLEWLYLPVSSVSGYMPFQFGQLIRVSGELRELNFTNWRKAEQTCLHSLKVKHYGAPHLRCLNTFLARKCSGALTYLWTTGLFSTKAFTFLSAGGQVHGSFMIPWHSPWLSDREWEMISSWSSAVDAFSLTLPQKYKL